jgi:hypothetical protein
VRPRARERPAIGGCGGSRRRWKVPSDGANGEPLLWNHIQYEFRSLNLEDCYSILFYLI